MKNSIFFIVTLILFISCEKGNPVELEEFYTKIEVVNWNDLSSQNEDISFSVKKWNSMPFMDFKRRIVKDLIQNHLKKGDVFEKDKFLKLISTPLFYFEKNGYVVMGYPIGKKIEDKLCVFFIIYDGKIHNTLFAKLKTFSTIIN